MTPGSSNALMTSPDFRRIADANSPTVTDSGTLTNSRLISAGADGSSTEAAGRGSTLGGAATVEAAAAGGLTVTAGGVGPGGTGAGGAAGWCRNRAAGGTH